MARPILTGLLFLATALKIADASNVEGRVSWNGVCPDYAKLGQSKVILDDGRYSGGIRRDGPDVDEGSYILSVVSHDFAFDHLRVDVHPSAEALPDVGPYVPGTSHNPPSPVTLQYPIMLIPRQKANYFVERQSFNALGMLQNPMVLMMIGTGVLVLGMPYIMKNLDPELAKEVNGRQARISNIQTAMQTGDFRGGISALIAESEVEAPNPQPNSPRPSGSTPKSKASKGGRRR